MTELKTRLISCRGLTKIYKMGESEVRALDGVDLDIHEGEFVAIIGSSGSGKSTLMNMLGALDQPTTGQVTINNENIGTMDIMALMTNLNAQGITIIVITHEDEVAAYAQRVIEFKDGRIISDTRNERVAA